MSKLQLLLLTLFASCASTPKPDTTSKPAETLKAFQKVPACIARRTLFRKDGVVEQVAETLLTFSINNVDGRAVLSTTVSLSSTVNAKCASTKGRLECTLGDAKRPTYIKASASIAGEELNLKLLDDKILYEIECKPRG